MRRLVDIVLLFKEYLLLIFYVLISLLLLALNDAPQIRTIRSLTLATIGAVESAFGFIPNYFELRSENTILREQNLSLSEELIRLREAKLENDRLRQLLALKERSPFTYVAATVVGKTMHLLQNTITLDVGEGDGVRPNMPIVTEGGLVGRVLSTSSRYAIGQILWNKDFRASAKVERGRVDAILQWEGGEHLSLKNVAKTQDVLIGDLVITSEYSTIYPSGIKIGIVSKTSQTPGALFQTIEVAPSVDLSRIEQVFVIMHTADSARVALEQKHTK
ncbi:MAG TPA: rod shape-determining protein MreC [Bacteroidetes bacterium]|jgi:rod shape-determining protein MreC|nr:rod shape-determining protein MreC [Bacteroidota bacterium]